MSALEGFHCTTKIGSYSIRVVLTSYGYGNETDVCMGSPVSSSI